MRWKVLGLVVFAVLVAVFTLMNSTQVVVDFLFVKASVNLVLVILLSVLLGMILMAILWSLRAWKLRGETNALRSEISRLESALADASTSGSQADDNGTGSEGTDSQAVADLKDTENPM